MLATTALRQRHAVPHVGAARYLHKAKFRSKDFGWKREETNPSSNCWSNTLSTRPPYTLWPSSARKASHGTCRTKKSNAGKPSVMHESSVFITLTCWKFPASTRKRQTNIIMSTIKKAQYNVVAAAAARLGLNSALAPAIDRIGSKRPHTHSDTESVMKLRTASLDLPSPD